MRDHVIRCILSDIPAQISGVVWAPITETTDGYILNDGIFDDGTNSQVSTLTISAENLVKLKSSAAFRTFTCNITVGSNAAEISAVKNITIINPSKITVF